MAIDFPNTPVNGSTYIYLGVKYTYSKSGEDEGFWHVTTPGSVGIATSADINEGVDSVKYITPEGLMNSNEWIKLLTAEANAKDDQSAGEIEAIVSHNNLQGVDAKEHTSVYHGRMNLNGGISGSSGFSGSRPSGGTFRVTHNLGHTNYTAIAQSIGYQVMVGMGISSNYFQYTLATESGTTSIDSLWTLFLD